MIDQDNPLAVTADLFHVVRDHYDGLACLTETMDALEAFFLEADVADGKNLVHQQYLWIDFGGHRERQPHVHARGILFYRRVNEIADVGEINDALLPV